MGSVPVCPICAERLRMNVCIICGWCVPSPWLLLSLLDGARNHVTDPVLRAEIQALVPPRPRTWPEGLPRLERGLPCPASPTPDPQDPAGPPSKII